MSTRVSRVSFKSFAIVLCYVPLAPIYLICDAYRHRVRVRSFCALERYVLVFTVLSKRRVEIPLCGCVAVGQIGLCYY
jgi:hypothetical protein